MVLKCSIDVEHFHPHVMVNTFWKFYDAFRKVQALPFALIRGSAGIFQRNVSSIEHQFYLVCPIPKVKIGNPSHNLRFKGHKNDLIG